MNLSGIMGRKVAGIPVIYLAGGGVAILAVVAWRMKPASGTVEEAAPEEDTSGDSPYDGLATEGTVIAPTTTAPPRPSTNDEWIRKGAEWLSTNKAVNPTAAYAALSKYINGQSRSLDEARWVDWVIKEQGFPPDPFEDSPLPVEGSTSGTVFTKPAYRPITTPVTIPDTTVTPTPTRPRLPYLR